MKTIVFCLEEPSAKEMLKGVVPRILSVDVELKYIVFQGKQDLEKQLVRRLRGWRMPNTRFVVLRDQDNADCHDVKAKLSRLCTEAGKADALVRVACRELESFYLGDLHAVEAGLGLKNLTKWQSKRKYQDPDKLANPVQEIGKLTHNQYQKMAGSRAIGPCLKLDGNRSKSFSNLIEGIRRLVEADE